MKLIRITVIISVCCCALSTLFADTIPGGDVSGTWYTVNSPYYIAGDIGIPASDTLTIEPGVEVIFLGYYPLTVNGWLEAVGTEADSIHFTASTYWRGLHFANAPDSSKLAFCTISHSGSFVAVGMGGINCTNSNPVITHCRISDNYAHGQIPTYAGGIALNNSNAEISWCDIRNNGYNGTTICGGGLTITNSSPVITGCNISGNKTIKYGGGIFITGNSSPMITNCTIEADTSNMYGGGIAVAEGVITISECTIRHNRADDGGGGIAIFGGSVSIGHCTFLSNVCWTVHGRGGGVFANGGTFIMDHCTLLGDEVYTYEYGMEIYTGGSAAMTVTNSIIGFSFCFLVCFESSTPPSVSYNDFYIQPPMSPYYFYGNVPSGLGELTQVNYNGDSCDVYYNIYLDPLFVDLGQDYHLTDSSFCIDAGDPASPLDPDGTISDQGRYWFNQIGAAEKPIVRSIRNSPAGATIFSGPLVLPEGKSFRIFDITGRSVMPSTMKPGIYFIEIDGKISQKVIKVR